MGKENELMNRILTSDDDGDSQPTAKQVLDDALRHVPLSIVVELVELRYRDQRNKFFLTVLGAVLNARARVSYDRVSIVHAHGGKRTTSRGTAAGGTDAERTRRD